MFKTDLARENWDRKYRYGNETEIQTWERVARALADTEKEPEKWYGLFLRTIVKFDKDNKPIGLKCTPGGRITANIGTGFKGATLSNCFINGPVSGAQIKYTRKSSDGSVSYPIEYNTSDNPDDLLNIFLTIMEQAKTLASEGGYGINFGFIRPRGSIIKGTGIKHPGVLAYLKIWDSVAECIVKGDQDGYVDKIKNYLGDEKFEELKQAVKKETRKGAMLAALNCFSENTEVLTDDGWVLIGEIIDGIMGGGKFYALDDCGASHKIYNPIKRTESPIYEVETEDGSTIEVTGDHEFEVKNIKTGEIYLKRIKDVDMEIELLKIIVE
jgi:hypothetical protein